MTVRVSTTNISCKKFFSLKLMTGKNAPPQIIIPSTIARKGLGKCVQTVSNTCSWPWCCLFLDTMENSNEQPCVCLYPRQAPHECRAMHAGMHHVRSKLRTSVSNAHSHASWGCRRLAAVCTFGLLWDCGRLLDKDETKGKRHYIILKRVHSPWASLGMQTLFSHAGPGLGQGQDAACWAIANVLLARIPLEANYVRDFPVHFNLKSYGCSFVFIWEPPTKKVSLGLVTSYHGSKLWCSTHDLAPVWQLTLSRLCGYSAQRTSWLVLEQKGRCKGGGAHLKMGRGVIGPKQCTERKQRKLSTSGVMGAVPGLEGGFFISQLVHSLLFVFVSIYITFEF